MTATKCFQLHHILKMYGTLHIIKHTKFNGRRWYLDDYELKTLIDNEQMELGHQTSLFEYI